LPLGVSGDLQPFLRGSSGEHGIGGARYIARGKVEAESAFKAVAMNLLKTASRIDLVAA